MNTSVNIAFWNLCNFFEAGSVDRGPSSQDEVDVKCRLLAATIRRFFDCRGPDLLACAEVNSKALLSKLAEEAFPGRYDVIWEGSDGEKDAGLGLCFDRTVVSGPDTVEVYPTNRGARLQYLLLQLRLRSSDAPFLFIVNHWKSRRGGGFRDREETASALGDRLADENTIVDAILVGDFNAEPFESPFGNRMLRGSRHFGATRDWRRSPAHLYNPTWRWLPELDYYEQAQQEGYRERRPTTSFGPKGRAIFDQLLVSGGLLRGEWLELCEESVRLYHDESIAEYMPQTGRIVPRKWTYDPIQQAGDGCSDHLPLLAKFLRRG